MKIAAPFHVGLLSLVLLLGCSAKEQPSTPVTLVQSADTQPPPPPGPADDFGDLDNFQSCSAKPRRELSNKEKCQIEKVSADCTPAADCLVTCLSSPDGIKIGGGCDHICFYPRHPWGSRPKAMDECDDLEDTGNG